MSDTVPMRPKRDRQGKVAVITGAASRIGMALALCAADQGMKVALADADEEGLAASLARVNAKSGAAIAVRTDISDLAGVRQLARHIEAELGSPWLVCNNSDISIDINLWGVINGVRVFAPDMVTRGGGHIVNIASAHRFGPRGTAAYVAATHAIVGLSESLYCELDSVGSQVGVTLVSPALDNTNVASDTRYHCSPRSLERHGSLKRLRPDELAKQIFGAVEERRFWVFAQASQAHATSDCRSDIARRSHNRRMATVKRNRLLSSLCSATREHAALRTSTRELPVRPS